jgi:hypothetical protein
MDHGSVAFIGLVVACGDAAGLLETTEEVFDEMTPFVHVKVASNPACPAGLGGMTAQAPRRSSSARSQSLSKALSPSSAANSMSAIKGSAATLSWRWPGKRTKRTRLPSASTKATILVVRPPRDRPIA